MSVDPASVEKLQRSIMGAALAGRAVVTATERDERASAQHSAPIDLTQPEQLREPEHVRRAARDALARGETHYTVRPGVPELRAAIAARSTADGFPAVTDTTVVTNGGAEALYIALQGTLRRGDHALVVGPVWPNVMTMLAFLGARVTRVAALDALPGAERAAVVLLASPSPVSGVEPGTDTLRRAIESASERGATVILDRSAAGCHYDGARSTFADAELGARVITTGSFSLSHWLAGWRVGWFSAPAAHMTTLRELKQTLSICTTAVSQFAALAALEGPAEWLDERRVMLARRRDTAIERLHAAGLPVVTPDAWPGLSIDTSSIDADDRNVAAMLREAGVTVDAGSTFGESTRGHIRIDLRAPEAVMLEGIERIAALGKRARA